MSSRSSSSPTLTLEGSTWPWLLLLGLGVLVYFLGLGGQYIPSNGDEMVYAHIARLTAESGHWLPLASSLDHMRNTKPPLLFWQAMVAGGWGQHWSLAALRLPSVIYTLLTATALVWTLHLWSGSLRRACIAACCFLAFFCTFRYGRPFLTSAPETFWLSLPMFWLLWQRLRTPAAQPVNTGVADASLSWLTHIGFGLALGLGLAYKSFALIAPAAAALWCAQLLSGPALSWRTLLQVSLKVGLSAALALAIFALWFVLDPDPAAVWQEFVVGENAGKMSDRQGYWQVALFGGGGSMWAQMLAYVQNAGLLALVVLGLMWVGMVSGFQAWQARRQPRNSGTQARSIPGTGLDQRQRAALLIVLVWLAVWLLVFMLPSQRSARYLIPAMPALALLLALCWERIGRGWFVATLLLCAVLIGALARIAWAAHEIGIGTGLELGLTQLAALVGAGIALAGLIKPAWTRTCTVAACLVFYACFGLATAPLNGASGSYSEAVIAQLHSARVAVPTGFNGQFERFQFLLPGNQFVPYEGEARTAQVADVAELQRLLTQYDAVAWLQADPGEAAPPCLPDCSLLGSRWEVKGRHQSSEFTLANVWYPQRWLFRREWLLARAQPTPASPRP